MCGIAATTAVDATAAVVDSDAAAARRVRTELRRLRLDELNELVGKQRVLGVGPPRLGGPRPAGGHATAFGIAANADRMGALAANIAMIGTRARTGVALPAATLGMFADMGHRAVDLTERAQHAVSAATPSRPPHPAGRCGDERPEPRTADRRSGRRVGPRGWPRPPMWRCSAGSTSVSPITRWTLLGGYLPGFREWPRSPTMIPL